VPRRYRCPPPRAVQVLKQMVFGLEEELEMRSSGVQVGLL
jgi:hypothetical protein